MENNSKAHKRFLWVVAPLLLVIGLVWALPVDSADNRLIPFQGRLTNADGTPLNGVFRITFVIYDKPTGGTALWSEVHLTVSVLNGQLNVLLGSMVSLDDPDGNGNPSDAVHFSVSRFLGITVGAASNQEMVPRHQLVPSFHARITDRALSVVDEGVTSPMIAPSAVKTSHIQNGTIQEEDLAPALAAAIRNATLAGTIILWDNGPCPTGFTRVPEYDGKFLVGSVSAGTTGGSNTHKHPAGDYKGPSHTHNVRANEPIWGLRFGHQGGRFVITIAANENAGVATEAPPTTPDGTGAVTGMSGDADSRPEFKTILLCKKG